MVKGSRHKPREEREVRIGSPGITFSAEDLAKVRELASLGISHNSIAYQIEINPSHFSRLLKTNPPLLQAIEMGIADLEKRLTELSKNIIDHCEGNDRRHEMDRLYRRVGWKTTDEVKVTVKEFQGYDIQVVSKDKTTDE